jgi:hypothetical protein
MSSMKHEYFTNCAIFELISDHVLYCAPCSKYTYAAAYYEVKQNCRSWERDHRSNATHLMQLYASTIRPILPSLHFMLWLPSQKKCHIYWDVASELPVASDGNKKQQLASMNGTCGYDRYESSTKKSYLCGWTVHFEINWLFITNKCTWCQFYLT